LAESSLDSVFPNDDKETDPTELNNLVDARPELAERLVDAWANWVQRVGVENVERLAGPAAVIGRAVCGVCPVAQRP
jgi:hypothetical protein